MSYDATVHAKAIELAKLAIEMTTAAGSGHPSSAASLAHIVTVLMCDVMRYDPANPSHPASDRLVLSEGHAVPIIYAAGSTLGLAIGPDDQRRPMTHDDALQLRAIGSVIDGHPNPLLGFPFFDSATGSLGQGLSTAAGLACAARLDDVAKRIYCIIGDGESRQGQITEALDYIQDHKLNNVCPIFNCNVYAQTAKVSRQQTAEFTTKKLQAMGFEVKVVDGHHPTEIKAALTAFCERSDGGSLAGPPIAIVANTIKGWGAASLQGNGHHGQAVSADDIHKVFAELDATAQQVGAAWHDGLLAIAAMTAEAPGFSQPLQLPPTFFDAMRQFGADSALAKRKWATRRAYGIALRALGHTNPLVVALDADVMNSTYSQAFHDDDAVNARFFECRIAEQNMISVAAGLSAAGKIPFVSTFGKFLTRAYDQIEMAIMSGANLKLVGSHSGASLGADGPSQMAMPDVAWFRAFTRVTLPDGRPAMYILNPADAISAYNLVVNAADHDGSVYIRTHRPDVPFLYTDREDFPLGGHVVARRGKDLLILASGYMVHEALQAADELKSGGIDATVVDLYCLPFDEEPILDLAQQNNGIVLTVEDNYGAGFGSAVAEAIVEDGGSFSFQQMYARRIPKSGKSPGDVMAYLDLAAADIVSTARALMQYA